LQKAHIPSSGKPDKDVVIEFQRYGTEVIAVDRHANTPVKQLISMLLVTNYGKLSKKINLII